ncbi:MAG: EAL domain-containing protein, partial [Oscillospiraceae bacterium]|nr:EAL domain-containing protein [Oscillospiraceae bacterium]
MVTLSPLQEAENAVRNKELIVYYQPQYDAVTNKLVSAEALVRRRLPDGSIALPGSFVPAAEETDLIMEIDWNVLEQVCCFLKKRIDAGHRYVPIAVNFSRRHIGETDFLAKLCRTVDGYGIPRNLIEVEITESAMMDGAYDIVAFVDAVRKENFNVAIDDFGSGFSSLSLVKDISANVLKID